MGLLISLWLLTKGILKRIYWLVPALFTDPFDLAERWFKVTIEPPQYLVWVLIAIGFVIASILTYHELRTQKVNLDEQVKNLIDVRPSISVSCETNYGNLRVVNNGNKADFRAKAQLIEGKQPVGEAWFIKWKSSLEIDQTIYKGESHILEVASCEWRIATADIRAKPFIRFLKGNREVDVETGQQICIYDRDLSPKYQSVQIEVRIFSAPAMYSPFKQRYLLKLVPDNDTVSIEEIPIEASNEL